MITRDGTQNVISTAQLLWNHLYGEKKVVEATSFLDAVGLFGLKKTQCHIIGKLKTLVSNLHSDAFEILSLYRHQPTHELA